MFGEGYCVDGVVSVNYSRLRFFGKRRQWIDEATKYK